MKTKSPWKAILSLLIVATMLLSLPLTAFAADPFMKYDEPITLTVVKGVTVATDTEDKTQNNEFLKFFEENYGIKLEYKWVTTPEQYSQRIALDLAMDDLADIVVVDATVLGQMIESGQAMDITQVWADYADELTKTLVTPAGSASYEMAQKDGKLYGIPYATPVLESLHGLFLREDWRVKLGLPEPKTLEDLEKILYAFANDDPDGNGVKDTYGIGLNKDLYGNGYELYSIANMMHAYPDAWVENAEGKIVYGSVQPEMKTVLEKLAKWYQDGLIDPEFTVKTPEQEAELTLTEKLGVFTGVQWAQFMSDALPSLWTNNPESDWKLWGLPSVDDAAVKPIVYDNTNQFIVITSKCKNPEAAVVVLNLLHKIGAGSATDILPTEDDFRLVWDDWTWLPFTPESIHGNVPKWEAVFAAIDNNDPSLVTYNYNALALYNDQMNKYINHPEYRTGTDDQKSDIRGQWATRFSGQMFGMATELNENGMLTFEKRGPLLTETMIDSQATLDKLELEAFTRIITGDADISEFDTFVDQWNALGGEAITAEINAHFGK